MRDCASHCLVCTVAGMLSAKCRSTFNQHSAATVQDFHSISMPCSKAHPKMKSPELKKPRSCAAADRLPGQPALRRPLASVPKSQRVETCRDSDGGPTTSATAVAQESLGQKKAEVWDPSHPRLLLRKNTPFFQAKADKVGQRDGKWKVAFHGNCNSWISPETATDLQRHS